MKFVVVSFDLSDGREGHTEGVHVGDNEIDHVPSLNSWLGCKRFEGGNAPNVVCKNWEYVTENSDAWKNCCTWHPSVFNFSANFRENLHSASKKPFEPTLT